MSPSKILSAKIHEDILRKALEAGQDPQVAMVCWIKDIPYDKTKVTLAERQEVKMLNHRLLYSPDFMFSINYPPKLNEPTNNNL